MIVCITCDIDSAFTNPKNLSDYVALVKEHDVPVSFFVNSEIIRRAPEQARLLKNKNFEIGGHGDIHKCFYGSVKELTERLISNKKDLKDFYGADAVGFRSPRIKHGKELYSALKNAGFRYSSNYYRKEILSERPFNRIYCTKLYKPLKPLLSFLARLVYKKPAKPFMVDGVIEFPITGPGDYEMITTKKGPHYMPHENYKITEVWMEILNDLSKQEDSVFVLLTHPQSIADGYLDAFDLFLKKAKSRGVIFKKLKDLL